MNNKELAKAIIKTFSWWELDKTPKEHEQDILNSLDNENEQDICAMLNYFKEQCDSKEIKTIINELNRRIKNE